MGPARSAVCQGRLGGPLSSPCRLDRPLWQFRFVRRPTIDNVLVWQIHGFAHVEGIPGRVDLNIMRPASDS